MLEADGVKAGEGDRARSMRRWTGQPGSNLSSATSPSRFQIVSQSQSSNLTLSGPIM